MLFRSSEEASDDCFRFLPEFYRQRGLLIHPDAAFLGIVADEQCMRSHYPVLGCPARFIRRDQFHGHYESHLALEESAPGGFVARCPNWQRGCPFRMESRRPISGVGLLRFNPFLCANVHEPVPQLPVQSRWPPPEDGRLSLTRQPDIFFALLAPHLDDGSLCALAATCRPLRLLLPQLLERQMSVELVWHRRRAAADEEVAEGGEQGDGSGGAGSGEEDATTRPATIRFEITGFRRSFAPVAGPPPRLVVQPQGPLIDHLQVCAHQHPQDLGQERVELSKFYGLSPGDELRRLLYKTPSAVSELFIFKESTDLLDRWILPLRSRNL